MASSRTITVIDLPIPRIRPEYYFKGEKVDFSFSYEEGIEAPINVQLRYGVGDGIPFGQCIKSSSLIKCLDVKVETKGPINLRNSAVPPLDIPTISVLAGQSLSSFAPDSIPNGKETQIALTFAKEYYPEPKIQAQSPSQSFDAYYISVEKEKPTQVKCSFNIPSTGNYSLVSNEVETGKTIEVTIVTEGRRLLMKSLSLLLLALVA